MDVIQFDNDIDIIVDRFRNLIDDECGSGEMAEILDNILFNYSRYLLMDKDMVGNVKEEYNELYWIRKLRDLFINKTL